MIPGIDILAIPLGYILWFIYRFLNNYFISIFLFTLAVRAATFPLSLKSQKMQADRAKLAPRLERLQKKYAKDKKKFQEKQMALYEKEGVSLTGGCLPMVVQMVVLFGIIAVIYAPLTHLSRIPKPVIGAALTAVKAPKGEDGKTIPTPNKLSENELKGYYKELNFLMVIEFNKQDILTEINKLSEQERKNVLADEYYDKMRNVRKDFNFFGSTLLERPWNDKGFAGINILWIIPLISWLTAFGSSFISSKYMSFAQGGSNQPGQGCQNNMMLIFMPLFSLFITFTVPGGVGIYWISSNIIAVAQTIILNKIYNPVKIRAQAEIEYEEHRKKKQEDKKRLAEARKRENDTWNVLNNSGKDKNVKKPVSPESPDKKRQPEESGQDIEEKTEESEKQDK